MDKTDQDISITEVDSLVRRFDKVGDEILLEFEERMRKLNDSILYKYHANFFYFLPKHYLLQIDAINKTSFKILPDQTFYINDKNKNDSFIFTPRIESILFPVDSISTKIVDEYISININFKGDFEYDEITIWLDPIFVRENKYFSLFFIKHILNSKSSKHFAEIYFENNEKIITPLELSRLNFQISPLALDVLSTNFPESVSVFNIKINDLFKYKKINISKINIYLKLDMHNYASHNIISYISSYISTLFKINMIPIFNSYEDYSYNINTDMQLSEIELRNPKNKHSRPISVLSVYENKKELKLSDFTFNGINKYYFNLFSQKLDYSVMLPDVSSYFTKTRLHAYVCWTDNIDLSDHILITSNELPESLYKFQFNSIKDEKTNYRNQLSSTFSLIAKLNSNNIFNRSTFKDILYILQVNRNEVELFLELVGNIEFNFLTNKLKVKVTEKYSKDNYCLVDFIVYIICNFINRNSSEFIKEYMLTEIRS